MKIVRLSQRRVRNEWFEVTLTMTHVIPFSKLAAAITGGGSRTETAELSTAINVIIKVRSTWINDA
jgi:hypothetical protein